MNFNAFDVKNQCVEWIRSFFDENGPGCNAILRYKCGTTAVRFSRQIHLPHFIERFLLAFLLLIVEIDPHGQLRRLVTG